MDGRIACRSVGSTRLPRARPPTSPRVRQGDRIWPNRPLKGTCDRSPERGATPSPACGGGLGWGRSREANTPHPALPRAPSPKGRRGYTRGTAFDDLTASIAHLKGIAICDCPTACGERWKPAARESDTPQTMRTLPFRVMETTTRPPAARSGSPARGALRWVTRRESAVADSAANPPYDYPPSRPGSPARSRTGSPAF
jgi:hypothetical protein